MIKLKDIYLRYPLKGIKSHSLKSMIDHKIGGVLGGRRKTKDFVQYVDALRNINLCFGDGQKIGVLGHNGAGKTTLLRVISGVYPPTKGSIKVEGRVNALTDFTSGMDPNASGLKNIIFRLAFMGYSFSEARGAVDEIVEFSELSNFIHLPVRTYSTGMFLRLAFSISTHFLPDILVMDEVFGAGDTQFKHKVEYRLDSLMKKSRIVILSSHDLAAIKRYCDTVIIMVHGEIFFKGKVQEATTKYLNLKSKNS